MASRRIPRTALMLDTQATDRRVRAGRAREVLVLGELPPGLRGELVARGALVTQVERLVDAFHLLAAREFDVVVVNPSAESHGLDFVTAMKEGDTEHQLTIATVYGARGDAKFLSGVTPPPLDVLEAARRRHRATPFVILPADGTTEYAVIVIPPQASFVEDGRKLPLATAIMTVDGPRLLQSAGPLA